MSLSLDNLYPLLLALGLGLLIGIERERLKGEGTNRKFAGIRTFTIASLLGYISMSSGSLILFALAVCVVSIFCILGYQFNKDKDPGLTTEISLVLTCFLGGMSLINMSVTASVGVALAFLLRIKPHIHYFVKQTLSETELDHLLLFVVILLGIFPFVPDVYLGPYSAFNPKKILTLMLVMMSISSASYILIRLFGERYGVIAAGFASGFISSTSTVFELAKKVSSNTISWHMGLMALSLSSISSLISIIVVISIFGYEHLDNVLMPFCLGFLFLSLSALYFMKASLQSAHEQVPIKISGVFNLVDAAKFALMVTLITFLAAASYDWLGRYSLPLTILVSGLIDVHAATASILSMVHSHRVEIDDASLLILSALSMNNLFKCFLATSGGIGRFAWQAYSVLLGFTAVIWLTFYLVLWA